MIEIRNARFPEDLGKVVDIFREYVASPTVDLSYQDYETEFANLPGNYAPPDGQLLLAWQSEQVVGCVALRKIDADICEMKRLYVRPAARGEQRGQRLVAAIVQEARRAGYSEIRLDVLPEFVAAKRIYDQFGFEAAEPVSFNPVEGTSFLGLKL
jgi:putative acetyltransferase